MATFQAQVQGITGVSVGTTPTTAELTQFLKDGVLDVTDKWLQVKPTDITDFTKGSAEQTSQGLNLNGAAIISVVRESGTNNDWRNCRFIPPGLQARVTDTESMHYASKLNPAYTILNNSEINVFPAPGADPNSFKAYYVNNAPINKSGSGLEYSHSDIGYFNDNLVRLVVLYASIKTLEAVMSNWTQEEEDLELTQATLAHVQQLKQEYISGFGMAAQQKPREE